MNFFLIYTIFIILMIVFSRMYYIYPLRKLISQVGGRINRKGEGIFPFEGRDIFFKYISGSRGHSPEMRIYTKGSFGAEALIRYENPFDRFYKQIGLNSQPLMPDRGGNDKLYFECDDQDFINLFLLNPKTKANVLSLLVGYSDIEITKNSCLLKKYPAPSLSVINKEDLLRSARELLDLASTIPAVSGNQSELAIFKAKEALLYFIGSVVLAAGVVSWGWASFSYRVVDDSHLWMTSLNYSITIIITVVGLVYYFIKGFSTSSKSFLFFFVTFIIGAILCGRYGTAVYNGFYDRSPAKILDQTIIDKYTTTSKGRDTYHIIVRAWHAGMNNWESTVSSCEDRFIELGVSQYRIVTRPGKLGYEWIVYQQIKPFGQRDFKNESLLPSRVNGIDLDNNVLDIPINPLLSLNWMSRDSIFSLRESYVAKIPSLAPENYKPSTNIFGQIEDGRPWWGFLGICYYGPGRRSIEGPARMSEFIANPYILVGVESPLTYPINNPYLAPKLIYPIPMQLKWDQGGAWGHVIYNVHDYYNGGVYYNYPNPQDLFIDAYNARDLGYNYFAIDPVLSLNIRGVVGRVMPIIQFIHKGGSCGYPGGCNNISPMQQELQFKWNDLPARVYIKLWKERPKNASQKSDMDFIIDLN